MAERHGGDELFQVRVARVLIELAVSDAGGKWLAVEREPVVFELDLAGEQSLRRELHREGTVHWPIVLRRKAEFLVAGPEPCARKRRREVNAARDCRLDLFERRDRFIEHNRQRLDRSDAVGVVFGQPRLSDDVGDVVRLGAGQVPGGSAGCKYEREREESCPYRARGERAPGAGYL